MFEHVEALQPQFNLIMLHKPSTGKFAQTHTDKSTQAPHVSTHICLYEFEYNYILNEKTFRFH